MTEIRRIFSITDIQTLVQAEFDEWERYGDVRVTEKGDLLHFATSPEPAFNGDWNPFEKLSQGLILRVGSGEIVARPFDKMFNWLQEGRNSGGYLVTVTEKLDGALGILYRAAGGYQIATKGGFETPAGRWATAFLNDYYDLDGLDDNLTLLFEIIAPVTHRILDYGAREDLVLLAARDRFTGAYPPFFPVVVDLAGRYGFSLPEVVPFNSVADLLEAAGTIDTDKEGWVAEFSDGQRFQFQGDRYIELNALLSQLTFDKVLARVADGTLNLADIPPEFQPQITAWKDAIDERFNTVKQAVISAWNEAPKGVYRAYVEWVEENRPDLDVYLMAMYEKKPLDPLIYKLAFEGGEASLDS